MFYDRDNATFFKDFAEEAYKDGKKILVIVDEKYDNTGIFSENFNANSFYGLIRNSDMKLVSLSQNDIISKYNQYKDITEFFIVKNIKYDYTGISEISLQYYESQSSDDEFEDGILR